MTKDKSTNTILHHATITREKRHGHKGIVVLLTGLSGSGKSTIAHTFESKSSKRITAKGEDLIDI